MASDIALTGHDPGWTNIPGDGIDLAASPGRLSMVTGISGDGSEDSIDFEIGADGSVVMLTEGFEPVIKDGKITAFRAAGDGS